MQDGAAPALHQSKGGGEPRQRPQGRDQRPGGHPRHRLADQSHRLARLLHPHLGPGLDVARLEHRHPHLEAAVGREGVVAPDVGVDAGGARHVAQHPVVARDTREELAGAFQPVHHQGVLQGEPHDLVEVLERGLELTAQIEVGRQIVADAAGDDTAPQEPVAGQPAVEPQQSLPDPEAVGVPHRVAGVVGDHAEVGHVVVEALHLQQDHA